MPYITQEQMIYRYGPRRMVELTDTEPPFTQEVQGGVLDRAIVKTDALIDAHLMGRYALPLSFVPPLLADIAATLTYAGLHVDQITDLAKADADEARKLLARIASGDLGLPGVTALSTAAANATVVVSGGPPRLYGRDALSVL